MDYLVALEAEDGAWYDYPEHVVGLQKARLLASAATLPRGYAAMIYELRFVETVKEYPNASATADRASEKRMDHADDGTRAVVEKVNQPD